MKKIFDRLLQMAVPIERSLFGYNDDAPSIFHSIPIGFVDYALPLIEY